MFCKSLLSVSCLLLFVSTRRAIDESCEQLFQGRSFWPTIDAYIEVITLCLNFPVL
ncbi:Uncharacterized protein TCM_002848 [Theobroma cacao]|uniref:Uncharacterized protein n=1 Tax=Theobroma cacao TaxID=3641 RepID=A0A061DP43_THECC|nr:Uncharacterized protein TCM_002848 [Theobroma cacao]